MRESLIYTTEPVATRALAAEIRHDPRRFIRKLNQLISGDRLGAMTEIACEKTSERIDIVLTFEQPPRVIGIEAKFDHELTIDQVDRELRAADHLVVLLLAREHAPVWLAEYPRVSVMTWAEALECFDGPRLTLEDVGAARSSKSAVEIRLKELLPTAMARLGPGWVIRVERGGAGMPAINFYSPGIKDRELRAVLQVVGRKMPEPGEPVMFRYSIGISVRPDDVDYPSDPGVTPEWVDAIKRLKSSVIGSRVEEFRLSTRRPSSGRANDRTMNGRAHARKLAIVDRNFDDDERWLTTGYIDWIVGPASVKVPLDQIDVLAQPLTALLAGWHQVESQAEQAPLPAP